MTEAERLFNQVYFAEIRSWVVIPAIRVAVDLGVPGVREQFRAATAQFLDSGSSEELIAMEQVAAPEIRQSIIDAMGDVQVNNALWAVDAATVVFAHSIVDAAATDYLKVCALAAPNDWAPLFDKRQISMQEFRERTYDEVLAEKIPAEIDAMARNTLISRVDRLHQLCPPTQRLKDAFDFTYDRDRIVRFDRQRQDVVHGKPLSLVFPTLQEDLIYLKQTTSYFMGLVGMKFGFKLDPTLMASS